MKDYIIKMKIILPVVMIYYAVTASAAIVNKSVTNKIENIEITSAQTLKVGDQVANFSLKSTSGGNVSLTDFNSSKGVIVVFTSNHCPFAKAYEDRLIALNSKFSPQGIKLLAINSSDQNLHPDDSFDKMKERASTKGYNFSYLSDDNQVVAKSFGATREPQAFLLQKKGSAFVVTYIGMIDDNPQDPQGVLKYYIDEAASSLLENKPVVTTLTKPVGCPIKWKN